MNTYTRDQKLAMLVVPVLLFGMLGATTAYAFGRNLTDEERAAIEEARDLREQGEFEKAQEVLKDAGVARGLGHMHGVGAMHEERRALRDAIEAEDYDAFLKATENVPFAEDVTREMFDTIVEAHGLREAGDHDGAHDLLKSAGIVPPLAFGGGIGSGWGRGGCGHDN